MIIYKDILTGDEIISDAYDLKPGKVPGLWEADCKKISIGGESFDTGANASAEGEDVDDTQDTSEMVIDVVHSFRLQQLEGITKKLASTDIKKYAKSVLEKLKEEGKTEQADNFKKTAGDAVKTIIGNWDNWDVFCGESMGEGEPCMWVFIDYREDGVTPYMTVFEYALEGMKV